MFLAEQISTEDVAFQEGRDAWEAVLGDVCRAHNPHPVRSVEWFAWNRGWNSKLKEQEVR